MRHKIVTLLEIIFFISFWLQTRVNLWQWWPDFFNAPLNSDYLIPFIYLSDITLITLLVVWVTDNRFYTKVFNGINIKPTDLIKNVWIWFCLFASIALISILVNGGEWWMWYGWLRLVEGIALAWLVANRWQQATVQRRAVVILISGLIVEALVLIGEWITQQSLGLQWLGEWSFNTYTPGIAKIIFNGQEFLRSYATFAHPNIAAAAVLVGIITLVWWYLERLNRGELVVKFYLPKLVGGIAQQQAINITSIFLITVTLFSLALFFTFSRSVWLVGLACIVLLLSLSLSVIKKIKITSRKAVAISLILGCILIVISPWVWSRFNSLDNTDRLSVDRRVQLSQVAMDSFQSQPMVGVGVNNFITQVANYGPLYGIGIWREPVHNLFLLVTVETGVFGLIAWLAAHSVIWINLLNLSLREDKRPEINLLVVIWLGLIILGLIDHYWWTSQQGRLVWWVIVGFSITTITKSKVQKLTAN